jgi:hypothetical protein
MELVVIFYVNLIPWHVLQWDAPPSEVLLLFAPSEVKLLFAPSEVYHCCQFRLGGVSYSMYVMIGNPRRFPLIA